MLELCLAYEKEAFEWEQCEQFAGFVAGVVHVGRGDGRGQGHRLCHGHGYGYEIGKIRLVRSTVGFTIC